MTNSPSSLPPYRLRFIIQIEIGIGIELPSEQKRIDTDSDRDNDFSAIPNRPSYIANPPLWTPGQTRSDKHVRPCRPFVIANDRRE